MPRTRWIGLIALAAAACSATPRPRPACVEARVLPRSDAMVAPRLAVDLVGAPAELAPHRTAQRDAPRAFMRVGNATSRAAITEARRAIAQGDCRRIRRPDAALASTHADHDYVEYLHAWCERHHGDRQRAYTALAELATTSDAELAPFMLDELFDTLASSAELEVARATLVTAGLQRPHHLDRFATALFAHRRPLDGRLLAIEHPGATPNAAELSCRYVVEQCRASRRHPWPYEWVACNQSIPADASTACRGWHQQGQLLAMLDWTPSYAHEDGQVVAAISALREPPAPMRDRLALIVLLAGWNDRERSPAYWRDLGRRARAIGAGATDPSIGRAVTEVIATATRNAEALEAARARPCRANAARR